MGRMTSKPWLLFILLLILSYCTAWFSVAGDTLSAGQSLSVRDTLLSRGSMFELGFFSPGSSLKNYLGIWYKNFDEKNPVWVANRENPLSDRSSLRLNLSEDGNLLLFGNSSNIPFWSTNLTFRGSNLTEAVLGDDGNFVLRDRSNTSSIFWESFDHPTDTWLPGAKLGIDKVTRKPQHLISWKNKEDPAPGVFSMVIDPNGSNQLVLEWNKSQIYLSSGVWDEKTHTFAFAPELTMLKHVFNYSFLSNENERYFIYYLKDPSYRSKFLMKSTGNIQLLAWLSGPLEWKLFWSQPTGQSNNYGFCGAFGVYRDNILSPCECLKGFEPFSKNDTGLNDWTGGCVRKFPLQCENNTNANSKKDWFMKTTFPRLPINSKAYSAASAKNCEEACMKNCSCTGYAYNSSGCVIWEGALLNLQQLSDGGEIIYLRLAGDEHQSTKGKKWKLWVAVLVPTTGLVLCLFICFSSKGKLKPVDPIKNKMLAWETRVRIIEGIAQGLLYLHQYSRLRIIHRDLKPSNILLDSEMNPKISDFGMARIVGGNDTKANTNRIVGTYGYMSPEYAIEGLYSIKSDVFSFGVLLLEIISGKKNTGFYNSSSLNLLRYAWELWVDDRSLELINPTIGYPSTSSLPLRFINIGLLCVQESPTDRPTMLGVVSMIRNEHAPLPKPKQPAFTIGQFMMDPNPTVDSARNCSNNTVTISTLEAR